MDRIKLNVEKIHTLPPGSYADTTDGLFIRISPTCLSWNFYRHNPNTGKPIRRSLGKFPSMTVEAARKAARAMQMELDKGNPISGGITFETLLDKYERHSQTENVRHPTRPRRIFNLSWSAMTHRKIATVTTGELKDAHDKISTTRGRVAASHAIKTLRALYNFATQHEWCEKNPAKNVRIRGAEKRDVFLNVAEVKVLRDVLIDQPQDVQDFFELLLLTGARQGNVCSMRWADIVGNVWTIPAEHFKTKKMHEVPLHPIALDILQRRKAAQDLAVGWNTTAKTAAYVFPTVSSAGHLHNPCKWIAAAREGCAARGVTKYFTFHDLRRTFASLLTAQGVPLTVVAKALGHANIMTTPIYARADTETVRKAVMLLE